MRKLYDLTILTHTSQTADYSYFFSYVKRLYMTCFIFLFFFLVSFSIYSGY